MSCDFVMTALVHQYQQQYWHINASGPMGKILRGKAASQLKCWLAVI
jgi:hypothetical protein